VERRGKDGYQVDLVAMVPAYIGNAQEELRARLAARLPGTPAVRVRQTLEANDAGRRDRADLDGLRLQVNALAAQARQLRAESDASTRERLRIALDGMHADLSLDGVQRRMVVTLPPPPEPADTEAPPLDVDALQTRLAAAAPGWTIQLVALPPPVVAAPPLPSAGTAGTHAMLP